MCIHVRWDVREALEVCNVTFGAQSVKVGVLRPVQQPGSFGGGLHYHVLSSSTFLYCRGSRPEQ